MATIIKNKDDLVNLYKNDRSKLAKSIAKLAVENGGASENLAASIESAVMGKGTNFGLGMNWALAGLSNLIFRVLVNSIQEDLIPDNMDFFKTFGTEKIEVGTGFIDRWPVNVGADVSDVPNFNSTSSTVQDIIVGKNLKNQPFYEAVAIPLVNSNGTVGKLFSITIPMGTNGTPGAKMAFTSLQAFTQIIDVFDASIKQTKDAWLKNYAWNFVFNEFPITNEINDQNNNIYLDEATPYIPQNLIEWTQNIFIPIVKRMATPSNYFNVDGGLNPSTGLWDFSKAIADNATTLTNSSATFANIASTKAENLIAFVPVGLDGKYEFGVQSNKFNYNFSKLLTDIPQINIVGMNKYINFSENNTQANPLTIPSMGSKIIPNNTIYVISKDAFKFGNLWELIEKNLWANSFVETLRISVGVEGLKRSWAQGVKFVSNAIAILPSNNEVN